MTAVTVERETEVGKVWLSEGVINLTNYQGRADTRFVITFIIHRPGPPWAGGHCQCWSPSSHCPQSTCQPEQHIIRLMMKIVHIRIKRLSYMRIKLDKRKFELSS